MDWDRFVSRVSFTSLIFLLVAIYGLHVMEMRRVDSSTPTVLREAMEKASLISLNRHQLILLTIDEMDSWGKKHPDKYFTFKSGDQLPGRSVIWTNTMGKPLSIGGLLGLWGLFEPDQFTDAWSAGWGFFKIPSPTIAVSDGAGYIP